MSLPDFVEGWLPPGHHPTTWDEIAAVFGGRPGTQRAKVLANLLEFRDRLEAKGIAGRLILDGSFISEKETPGDFDCLLIYDEKTENLMNQNPDVARILSYGYWKQLGYCDLFIFSEVAVRRYPTYCDIHMFDEDKHTRKPKGIVEVAL